MKVEQKYEILDKEKAIAKINYLAQSKTPFLFVINYKCDEIFVIEQSLIDDDYIRFSLNQHISDITLNNPDFEWISDPVTFNDYKQKFDKVLTEIHFGNSFLVNLTQETKIKTNLSLLDIFKTGIAPYKLWMKDMFTVLSPESFIKIHNGIISSFPMKGTIDADIPHAKELIMNDIKEKAEHATIVDLIRNDLSMVAEDIEVKSYRYIDTLHTNRGKLLQVSSEIRAKLHQNFHNNLGDILFKLLPAGSICGAPKTKTLQIIDSVEGYNRKFYTGIFGYFDGYNLDSAVMIRFIENQEGNLVFKSGGGITAKSNCEKEYDELLKKVYVPIR